MVQHTHERPASPAVHRLLALAAIGGAFLTLLALLVAQRAAAEDGNHVTPTFTAAQVEAGEAAYALSCAACHGPELDGMGAFPVLTGVAFQERWDGRPLGDLVAFVSQNMPLGTGGSLSTDTYAALVAYILARNGAEPGDTALDPADEDALGVTLAFPE